MSRGLAKVRPALAFHHRATVPDVGSSFRDRSQPGRNRDALEMLERSHRRLEERLAELNRAAGALARSSSGDHIATIDMVIDYLDRSAARHEVDEEASLFPRLRRHDELAPMLDALTDEHRIHQSLHGRLRTERSAWPAAGPDASAAARLVTLASELGRAYRGHITREESELLPAARGHLSTSELDGIRREMDERRGRDGDGKRERGDESSGRRGGGKAGGGRGGGGGGGGKPGGGRGGGGGGGGKRGGDGGGGKRGGDGGGGKRRAAGGGRVRER
jgi:hemerythrin-like domain-containing protein